MARHEKKLWMLAGAAFATMAFMWLYHRESAENRRAMIHQPIHSHASPRVHDARPRSQKELTVRPVQIIRSRARETETSDDALANFIQSLQPNEMHWLLVDLDEFVPEDYRDQLRCALLTRLAQIDPAGAAAFSQTRLDGARRDHALGIVMELWSQNDAESAANWLQDHEVPTRTALMDGVIARWMDTDFDGALQWSRELPDDASKERILVHLGYRWLDRDPAEALRAAQALPSATHQLVSTLVSQWAMRDPKAAVEWARQLPEGPQRTQVIASLIAAWAETSPRDAAAFAVSLLGSSAQHEAFISAISGWGRNDPQEAFRWVEFFPEGEQRVLAFTHIIPAWAERDAASAAERLLAMPEGPGQDAAFDALSSVIADRYPQIARALRTRTEAPAPSTAFSP